MGNFSGFGEQNVPINISIAKDEGNGYLFSFNGMGPEKVYKKGQIISLKDSGLDITIEANANGLIFRGNGKSVVLNREIPSDLKPKVLPAINS
ncbi:MAG: hypothetical protein IPL31_04715 [Saprospiraceae bacterium]|nr:hypothetical protein [Saprospiraceae bacterium]